MAEATIYLSPNGQDRTDGDGPATRLVVATIEGIATLRRADPGSPWQLVERSLTDRHVGQLVFDAGSGRLFAGAHADGGLWVSEDPDFRSWRPLDRGLTRPHLYALTAGRGVDGSVVLFAGTSPAALYRSDDLGESWREITAIQAVPGRDKWTFPPPPHIAHVKHIVCHPGEAGTLFFCIEQGGLFRSRDDGRSWTELTGYIGPDDKAYRDIHRLLINPADHDEFYLATGEGLYRSDDAGESWSHLIDREHELGYPDFLQIDTADNRTVFVAGAARSVGGWYREGRADSTIMRSGDAGRSWTRVVAGLPQPMVPAFEAMSLHAWPGGMALSVGTATGEVYLSEDRGEHWSCVIDSLPPISKDEHYLPFFGKRPGSDHTDDPTWDYRRSERTG